MIIFWSVPHGRAASYVRVWSTDSGRFTITFCRYGIITTAAIQQSSAMLTAFICHKLARGFRVHVFTETVWASSDVEGASGAATDRPAKL